MTATTGTRATPVEFTEFDGLEIAWDARILQPRVWTAEQGRWAAELAATTSSGPILELCCGAGQIGLLAARLSGRPLVQVDRDPAAAAYARRNAAAAGISSDVRCGSMTQALAPEERFDVVIADPPWLRTADVAEFPDDPPGAVDGGADGCDLIRTCIDVALAHLAPQGHVLVQIGDLVELREVEQHLAQGHPSCGVHAVWDLRPGGILVHLGPRA